MSDAYLSLSVKCGDATPVIADLLRTVSFPDRPVMVRRDRDRLRMWWMVEVHGPFVFDHPPTRIVSDRIPTADDAGRKIAPTIHALFSHEQFDARWRLRKAVAA